MDLSLLADEVWTASKEAQARAHDSESVEVRHAYLEAHYHLQAAVNMVQWAQEILKKVGEDG